MQEALEQAIARQVLKLADGKPNTKALRQSVEKLISSILAEQGPGVRTTVLVMLEGDGAALHVKARMRIEELQELPLESRLSKSNVIPIRRARKTR